MAESSKKKKSIPIEIVNTSVIEEEFQSARQKFEESMKKMDEELNKFGDQVKKQSQSLKEKIGTAARQTMRRVSQFVSSPLISSQNGNNILKVRFNMQGFDDDEIKLYVVDNNLVVEAKHEEKTDTKSIYKEYRNQVSLPDDANIDSIKSTLSKDKILTVEIALPIQTEEPETKS